VVISAIALFVAIGGVSWAATKIGTSDIKNGAVTAKKLHKGAVTKTKLHGNSVTSGKVIDNSLTGADINESTLGQVPSANHATNADNSNHANTADTAANANTANTAANANTANTATNANQLGGLAPGAYQQKSDLLFATVAPAGVNPAIVRGRGATAVTRDNPGSFSVTFNRDVTGCTWLATYGFPGNGSVDAVFATVRGKPSNNDVGVVLFDDTGAQVDGLGFNVEVLCP